MGRWRQHLYEGVAESVEKSLKLPEGTLLETPWRKLAPELQHLVTKRTAIAKRLKSLHAAGLCTHVAQALWRTATASDSTFTARTTGLDTQTAQKLDQITINFWEEWLGETLTHADIS